VRACDAWLPDLAGTSLEAVVQKVWTMPETVRSRWFAAMSRRKAGRVSQE
jgi:hypothetical protein